MKVTHLEYPEGPVLHIQMQSWDEVDCVGCGKEIHKDDAGWERVEFDSGGAGWQPYCRPCFRKYADAGEEVAGG